MSDPISIDAFPPPEMAERMEDVGVKKANLDFWSMFALAVLAFFCANLFAFQEEVWDTTQPRGRTREIDFTTSEGTWMSVDISPDGRWLLFDLLAQLSLQPGDAIVRLVVAALQVHPDPDRAHHRELGDVDPQLDVLVVHFYCPGWRFS